MENSLGGPPAPPSPGTRLGTALAAAAVASWASRTLRGGGGGVIGGRVLLKLAPDAIAHFARQQQVLLVTGTNGKSSTTAMLAAAMRSTHRTVTNADGANTPPGIATTLSSGPATHAVLETDESWLPWAVAQAQPRVVVLLNLSRDQLHRNPEVLSLAASWRRALTDVPLVVANVDDPAVVWAARAAKDQVWVAAGQEWSQDSLTCPACGSLLDRSDVRWSCRCGFRRPCPTWVVEDGRVLHHDTEVAITPALPGAVNLANATMAVAAATACDVSTEDAAAAVGTVQDVAGRFAQVRYGEHEVRLILAKNPAGWQAAMHITRDSTAPLVVAFNSEGVDGRDPSWLYDVEFDAWRERTIAVCGRRATDMAVRLQTDAIEPLGQFDNLAGALRALPPGPVDLVANYTAFQDARKVLAHG